MCVKDDGTKSRQEFQGLLGISSTRSTAPDLCNTGAISSNHPQPIIETGGLDTVYISIYGSWKPGMFPVMSKRFDDMKAAAESGLLERSFMQVGEGDNIRMEQAGAKKGVYYRWVFEWEGNRVYILNREGSSETVPSISVQFGSLTLMRNGLEVLWEAFLGLINHLGFNFEREIVSRVDPCVDLPGVKVTEFIQPWLDFRFITRGKNGTLHFTTPGVYNGMTLGGDRVRFRIYDKLLESKHDLLKLEVLEQKRWGGRPEAATRVEFQVERECLRERWGIDTVADLKQKLPQLCHWLTSDWIRFTECKVDRDNKNHQRAATLPLWQQVQYAFQAWVGQNTQPIVISARVVKPKAQQLTKQAGGCLKTALALIGKEVRSQSEFLWRANELLREIALELFPQVEIKRRELQAAGVLCFADPTKTPF